MQFSLRAVVAAIGITTLVTVGLLAFEIANWDRITPGVSALGVNLGGLSQADAATRLAPAVQALLDRPIDIRAADQSWRTTPRQLGMGLAPSDLADSAYAVGRQGNPLSRLGQQLGALAVGNSVEPASTTDQAALSTSLSGMAQQVERAPVDARISVAADGSMQATTAAAGLTVDVPASLKHVEGALGSGAQSVDLVTQTVPPAVSDDQLQAARSQLDRLFGSEAQPLTLNFGQQSWQLTHADLASMVSFDPTQASSVQIDDGALRAWTAKLSQSIDQSVQDARFHFDGKSLQVLRPSKQGRKLDQDATVQGIKDALLNGRASLDLPVSVVEPSVSSENPQALGITELIERGSTSFAGSVPEKKHNIQLAAERLNGIVVAPGQTFSFNDAVGPTTIAAGYQWGFAIESGDDGPRTVPSVAGGICQVATTLFQPVFWAGYQLEERYWHLYWIPAYTSRGVVGLDVTVDSDAGLDFQWTNTTPDYVLIQSASDESNVYFALYGKKPPWKVSVDDAVITNRTPPDTRPIAQPEPTLPWGQTLLVETARDGFDAEIKRHVVPTDGSKPRDLDLKSTYQPAHTVTLVGTGGKPASADLDAALQRAVNAQKPAPAATATPAPAATSAAAAPTSAPSATAAAGNAAAETGSATAKPTSPPAAKATTAPATAAPAATPKTQPTSKPQGNGIAPTPTPAH